MKLLATVAVLTAGLTCLAAGAIDDCIAGATLAVAGRVNATPSVAASGPFVAVAWGASIAGGGTESTSRRAATPA